MVALVAILNGPKATAWVYDHGTHLQVQFQKPRTLGIENRIWEFPLPRPFYRRLLESALLVAEYRLR